jgi:hypothetical protein
MVFLCKKNDCCEIKEVNTECILVKSSEKGYGSKRAVLPMMTVMLV